MAIDTGDLDLCKHLIGSGTDLVSGFQSCLGCRPFLYSLQSGQFAIAEYLIARGASVAGSSCERWLTRGFTAFHHAAASGSVRLLQLLLEKAPGEIYVNNDPIHPIHIAVLKGNDECVELILEHVSQGMNPAHAKFGVW